MATVTLNTGTITKPLMIELEGVGPLKLQPKDYVVSGGEGAIYKPSADRIIKIYHDRDKMRHDGMPQKIQLLSKVNSPFIVNPKGLVYENQLPIGYHMRFEDGESLAKIITSAYRQRENFGDKDALLLVENMREAVSIAHTHQAILVDANELNWLVQRKRKAVDPKLLDVDSWKIGSWDASVIMTSIRDWHTHGFDEGSDWFSWAVVTFQVFTGVHPYKGALDGFKMNDIETRMKANKSVFTPNVRLNSAVRDFGCINGPLLDWYRDVFEGTTRTIPPSAFDSSHQATAAVTRKVAVTKTGDMVILDKLFDRGSNEFPLYVFPCGVVRLSTDYLVDLHTQIVYQKKIEGVSCEIISTAHGLLLAEIFLDNTLKFTLLTKDGKATPVDSVLTGGKLLRYQNRLFVANQVGLTEVTIKVFAQPKLVTTQMWQYMYNSTHWFTGVGVQDALGAMFLIAPFGDRAVEYVRVEQLDKLKIINAMAGTRYIVAISIDSKTGDYKRHEFIFDQNYKSYTYKVSNASTPELNTAMLPKGPIVYIPDDGKLTIEVPMNGAKSDITDSRIKSSFTLFNWENRVVYTDGNQVWSIASK